LVIIGLLNVSACRTQSEPSQNQQNPRQATAKRNGHNPKAAHFNVQLGLGYLQQGDVRRAKRKLLLALQQDPKSSLVNDGMAYYLERTQDYAQAEHYYRLAIEHAPGDGAALNNYGTYLCRRGKFHAAELQFQAAVRDPNYVRSADAYENAGLCALELPNLAKARFYFNNALAHEPGRATSLVELTKIAWHDKQYKDAKRYIAQFNKIHKPTAQSTYFSYLVAKHFGKKDDAASYALLLRSEFAQSNYYQKIKAAELS